MEALTFSGTKYAGLIASRIMISWFFSFSRKYETRYYEGVHRQDETVRALWIEMNALGKPLCYPCVLWEGEKLMAFRSGMTRENKAMMQRWTEVISPEKKEEFSIDELEETVFSSLYQKAKDKADQLEGLIMPDEEDWTDEELLADESLADEDEDESSLN